MKQANNEKKITVITGAAQGIGASIAYQLAERGYPLALVDIDTQKLEHTAEKCCHANGTNIAKAYTANIANENSITECINKIVEDFGHVDILINNAGIMRDGLLVKAKNDAPIEKMSLEQWQSVIDVNLTGVFLCTREVAAIMIKTKIPGLIINMSSLARHGNFGQTNYSASKAGVAAMTVTWARELAQYGIRCVAIAPGVIDTDMTAKIKPHALEHLISAIPMKKLGSKENITKTVQFIIDNEYVNGRIIEVDGGLRI